MKNILLILFFSLLFFFCRNSGDLENKKGNVITDDLGFTFSADINPEKIIALTPSITEIIFSLHCEDKLAGNTIYCDYPPEAKKIPKVGDLMTIDFERIIKINPDMIFVSAEGSGKSNYDKLKKLGFKVFVTAPKDYAGIKKSYSDIAGLLGKSEFAERKIAGWDSVVVKIREENDGRKKLRTLYLIGINPLFAAGENTFIDEIMKICGLENIAAGSNQNYPVLNPEQVIEKNPEIIIYPTAKMNFNQLRSSYTEWKDVEAFKTGRVYFVDENLFSRSGPRFAKACSKLDSIIRGR